MPMPLPFCKTLIDGAGVTFCEGRVFHSRAAATGKARSPTVERRVRRTPSDDDEAERRRPWRPSVDVRATPNTSAKLLAE